MSIAFKKNSFRVEIRRQNLSKILQHKRLQQLAHTQVNQAILQYLNSYPHAPIPKICVIQYELIDEEHLHSLIQLLNQNLSQINTKKAFDIALLNKLFFADQSLSNKYFIQVTQFAEKFLFALPISQENNDKQHNQKGPQKMCAKLPANLIEDFMFLPNCLLQYWANFFSSTDQKTQIPMKAYCTIMKSFNKWFSSKGQINQNFNKYSVCYFLRNFFSSEIIFQPSRTCNTNDMYKQIEELYIRFRIISMALILRLLEEQFYCEELIHLMDIMKNRKTISNDLLRTLRESEEEKYFFEMLLDGMDNENIIISKGSSITERFFHLKQSTQENLKTLSQLSIQKILKEDISKSIWNCKISILDTFNTFLTINNFEQLFYESQVEKIIQKLIGIYIYSTDQDKITSRIQKTICIILYNILLLTEAELDSEEDEFSCLKIKKQFFVPIEQRISDYCFQNNWHFSEIVIRNSYKTYDQIVEMVALLHQFSKFLDNKEIDMKIMEQGRLVMKICDAFEENIFDEQEGKKIMNSLFDYLERLNDCNFDFSSTLSDLQRLKESEIKALLSPDEEDLLDEILMSLESQDQII